MNTFKLLLLAITFTLCNSAQAQVSINVNLGSPPAWGPSGYSDVRYYYLPDVEAYYDVQSSMFIYYSGNRWVRRTYLPTRYRNYNLHNGYKVVMRDYHGNSPYYYYKEHKSRYARGYRGNDNRNHGEWNKGPKQKHNSHKGIKQGSNNHKKSAPKHNQHNQKSNRKNNNRR